MEKQYFVLSFFVAFLAIISYANAAVIIIPDEELFNEKATWIDFQKRHILEPVGDNSGYLGWSRTQWNTFLRTRIDNYGSKAVNTFIISTPDAIRNNLADATQQHNGGTNLFWSTRTFTLYVMSLVGSSYDSYNCGRLFFLAGLDSSKLPVHFHGHSTYQPPSGSLPLNLQDCTKIN